MDNTLRRSIELCLAVYRITDKFPRGETLKQKLCIKSIDIIEDLIYNRSIPTNSSRIFNSEDLPVATRHNFEDVGGKQAGPPKCIAFGGEQNMRILFAYFAIAENQDWVHRKNFSLLRDEYRKLYMEAREQFQNLGERRENSKVSEISTAKRGQERRASARKQPSLTARQEKILGFLRTKEDGQAISDIAGKTQTSNKTAERELKKLIGMGRARKQGNTRGARFLAVG